MCKTKFATSSIFGWPDSKLNKSLWDFGASNIFLKALIFGRPKNGLVKSEPVTCGSKAEFDRFLCQDEQLSHVNHDSFLHSCTWFSLVGKGGENEYDGRYWSGLVRYPYHRQQRKLYHCFPRQHKQHAWKFFDQLPYAIAMFYKKTLRSLVHNSSFITDSAWFYAI